MAAVDEDRTFLASKVPWVESRNSIDDVRAYFDRLDKRFSENLGFCIGIFFSNKLAGEMKVHTVDWNHRKAEIGYWLRKSSRGSGLATRSAEAVCRVLFETLKLNRVYMTCATDNPESRRVPERLDFVKEGILRKDHIQSGESKDSIMYALTNEDWQGRRRND